MQEQPRAAEPARHVQLDLAFPPLVDPLPDAVVHVVIEDIGEADAPAPVLHRRDFSGLRIGPGDSRPTLRIELPDLSAAALPAIRVHVDRSGTGDISAGDFLNPAIVVVPAAGQERCRVDLVEVR